MKNHLFVNNSELELEVDCAMSWVGFAVCGYCRLIVIIFITILAIFILDEKVGIRRWIAIFFGFIGVLIVFRPGTSLFNYFSLLPLLGAIALSFAVIIMKKLLIYFQYN